jgi:glycine cleavage system H lipoate-binding protein
MPDVRGFHFPAGLFYLLDQDMWAQPQTDGHVRIGITDLGARLAGEFYAFMPKPVGTAVEFGGSFGLVEMAKALRSVRATASGTVVAVNAAAVAKPTLVNTAPYSDGWLMLLAPDDWPRDAARLARGDAVGFEAAMTAYMDLYDIR